MTNVDLHLYFIREHVGSPFLAANARIGRSPAKMPMIELSPTRLFRINTERCSVCNDITILIFRRDIIR